MTTFTARTALSVILTTCLALGCGHQMPAGKDGPESLGGRVLTLKKYGAEGGFSPIYKIEVKADRTVIYRGIGNVRLIGEHSYQLTEEKFSGLLRFLEGSDFAALKSTPPNMFGIADVTVWKGGRAETKFLSVFSDPKGYVETMRSLESFLESRRLRCPHMVRVRDSSGEVRTEELCQIEEEGYMHMLRGRRNDPR